MSDYQIFLKARTLIFFLCIAFSVLKAQEQKFALMPALGLTASQIHGDNYAGYNKLGFMGGLMIEAKLNKVLDADFGITFIQKGSRRNQNPEKFDYRFYYVNLNYVEVPLMLKYNTKRVFLTIGGAFAYLINYVEESEIGNLTGMFPFQKYDYSVNVGMGMNIMPKLAFELRCSNSFMTTRPFGANFAPYYNNILAKTFNKGYYNNVLQMLFTYKITPKKKSESVQN